MMKRNSQHGGGCRVSSSPYQSALQINGIREPREALIQRIDRESNNIAVAMAGNAANSSSSASDKKVAQKVSKQILLRATDKIESRRNSFGSGLRAEQSAEEAPTWWNAMPMTHRECCDNQR